VILKTRQIPVILKTRQIPVILKGTKNVYQNKLHKSLKNRNLYKVQPTILRCKKKYFY